MKLQVKDLILDNNVFVAPMAGVTDLSYRLILKEFGAGLIYTEMISDKGLLYDNQKTKDMIEISDYEKPIALQLFGSDVESMVNAAILIDKESNCDIIDINMGCPVPKVTKAGSGSKLMTTPELAKQIVSSIVKVVNKPVSVKFRSGWDHRSINAVSFAKAMEEAGASLIAIHGRTRTDMYSGRVDLDIIKEVKAAVKIPVIGNGDIKSPEDAKMMIDYTNCDGVMIGRGLMGNPWLIKQTVDYLETGNYEKEISIATQKAYLLKHLDNLIKYKGEHIAILEMRTHGAWYVKGLPGATKIKTQIVHAKSVEEIVDIINNYFDSIQ
ncbi:MAG: tRNA dihydrouridine synthase DusB [Tenericutes bacterium HGW-Tenericutes-7]|nr:MAG: tRNA dihydrouridine synthase DusB [Tenericutes bacterium HGW-Tenericutes-7]